MTPHPEDAMTRERALEDDIWDALVAQCAATPKSDHHKVKKLVTVSRDDVEAAIRALAQSDAQPVGWEGIARLLRDALPYVKDAGQDEDEEWQRLIVDIEEVLSGRAAINVDELERATMVDWLQKRRGCKECRGVGFHYFGRGKTRSVMQCSACTPQTMPELEEAAEQERRIAPRSDKGGA